METGTRVKKKKKISTVIDKLLEAQDGQLRELKKLLVGGGDSH